jgi:hypothetical protein
MLSEQGDGLEDKGVSPCICFVSTAGGCWPLSACCLLGIGGGILLVCLPLGFDINNTELCTP